MEISANARPVYSEDYAANRWHFKEDCVRRLRRFSKQASISAPSTARGVRTVRGGKRTAVQVNAVEGGMESECCGVRVSTRSPRHRAGVGKDVRPVRRDVLAEPDPPGWRKSDASIALRVSI